MSPTTQSEPAVSSQEPVPAAQPAGAIDAPTTVNPPAEAQGKPASATTRLSGDEQVAVDALTAFAKAIVSRAMSKANLNPQTVRTELARGTYLNTKELDSTHITLHHSLSLSIHSHPYTVQVKVEPAGNDGIRVYESHDTPVAKEKFTPSSAESLVHDILLVSQSSNVAIYTRIHLFLRHSPGTLTARGSTI